MTIVFISKVFISLVAFLYLIVARADLHRLDNRWLFDAGWALFLLLLATGIAGCEPKTRFVRCTQADCVDQTNSLLWSDDVEQRAFERALQRTIERQEAERRWLHSQI